MPLKNGIMHFKCMVRVLSVKFVFNNDLCGGKNAENSAIGLWLFITSSVYANDSVSVCLFWKWVWAEIPFKMWTRAQKAILKVEMLRNKLVSYCLGHSFECNFYYMLYRLPTLGFYFSGTSSPFCESLKVGKTTKN